MSKPRRRKVRVFQAEALFESLENRTLLASGLADVAPVAAEVGAAAAPASAGEVKTLDDLDPLARYAISASMGADQAAYAAAQTDTGYFFTNQYNVSMTTAGATFQSGSDTWQFTPESFGYGADQQPFGDAAVSAEKNRVTYDAAGIDTWFVNGPAGVQQGFTLEKRPAQGDPTHPLVVQVGLGGSLSASVQEGGLGLVLSRADGTSVMNFGGLVAFDATGQTFDARMELVPDGAGQDLRFVVNDTGAVYPLTIDPVTTITETAELKVASLSNKSAFGKSVALSSDGLTVLVGAPDDDNGIGAVYVYVRPTSGWSTTSTYTARLSIPVAIGEMLQFGTSLSVSADGSTALIGTSGMNSGQSAFVFARPSGGWTSTTSWTARFVAGGSGSSGFGRSVSLSGDGNTAIVGAPFLSNSGKIPRGAAYIYVKPSSGWVHTETNFTAKLTLGSSETAVLGIGSSVSMSHDGNTAMIFTKSGGTYKAAAYFFSKPESGWASTSSFFAKISTPSGLSQVAAMSPDASTVAMLDGGNSDNIAVYSRPGNGIWATTSSPNAILSNDYGGFQLY